MRTITAILIDPFACNVSTVLLERSNLQTYYKALSHESMAVDCFTCAYPEFMAETNDAVFVDDNGLLKDCTRFFRLQGYHEPLAGKGLIVGADRAGDAVSAKIALGEIMGRVSFYEVKAFKNSLGHITRGLVTTRTPWVKETMQ